MTPDPTSPPQTASAPDHIRSGPKNLITDIAGLRVGHAEAHDFGTGSTVLLADTPITAGVHVMGGAPGTRETDLLAPDKTVQTVDAIVLSGGSAFGLAAADGVADGLRAQGRGFAVGAHHVPIVPAAILFDLMNGAEKSWDRSPYYALGQRALADAAPDFAIGSVGAGVGATTATLKGGLGSASVDLGGGLMVGALVAANPIGDVCDAAGRFWAAPWECDAEFGGHGAPRGQAPLRPPTKLANHNTTIAIVATNAPLTQAQCARMATAAHDGMARAIQPSHSPMDGDLVFGVATGTHDIRDDIADPLWIGHGASIALARAIARAIYAATAAPYDIVPTWRDKFDQK